MRPKGVPEIILLQRKAIAIGYNNMLPGCQQRQPAQQDSCFTSLMKVWAQSFRPSTMVR